MNGLKNSQPKTPLVVAIVLNYNVAKETLACVKSLRQSAYDNLKIVVVDNKSPDGSAKVLAKSLPKEVVFIANNSNTGYAGGNNVGLRWALRRRADYAFILNPDTTVDKMAIAKMVALAESSRRAGFIGPRIFHPDGTIYSNGGKIHWSLTKATLNNNGQKVLGAKLQNLPFKTDYVSGTALLVSRGVLQDVGLMREDYFLYYEDTDWSWRCRKKGYDLLIEPNAKVIHKGYQSTRYLSDRYIYYHTRNGLFMAFWNGAWPVKWLAILSSIFKILKQPIKWLISPSKRPWVKPVLRGILDAWLNKTGPYPGS